MVRYKGRWDMEEWLALQYGEGRNIAMKHTKSSQIICIVNQFQHMCVRHAHRQKKI